MLKTLANKVRLTPVRSSPVSNPITNGENLSEESDGQGQCHRLKVKGSISEAFQNRGMEMRTGDGGGWMTGCGDRSGPAVHGNICVVKRILTRVNLRVI